MTQQLLDEFGVPLLAKIAYWERLGDRFSGDYLNWQASDTIGMAALGLGIGGLFLLLSLLNRWQRNAATRDCPKKLFVELARAHGLGFSERRKLREATRQAGLSEPAEVFVRPDLHDAVEIAAPGLAQRLYRLAD